MIPREEKVLGKFLSATLPAPELIRTLLESKPDFSDDRPKNNPLDPV